MLVLTRKCQQEVVVEGYGGSTPMLTVTVLEIRDGRVKLGFDVATDVPADRREVWEYVNDHDGEDRPAKTTRRTVNARLLRANSTRNV